MLIQELAALDVPFFLLPFRPTSDPSAARTFIRNYFDGKHNLQGEYLLQELRLTEPMVHTIYLKRDRSKLIVSRCYVALLNGAGADWQEVLYHGIRTRCLEPESKVGQAQRSHGNVLTRPDSEMARDSFTAFIPVSVDSDARAKIIFDFFDLLAAIAAHGKTNGLGGRKLSRLAGWWAFDHASTDKGFDGGYKGWSAYVLPDYYVYLPSNTTQCG